MAPIGRRGKSSVRETHPPPTMSPVSRRPDARPGVGRPLLLIGPQGQRVTPGHCPLNVHPAAQLTTRSADRCWRRQIAYADRIIGGAGARGQCEMDTGRKMRKLGGRSSPTEFSRIGNSLLTNGGAIPMNYDHATDAVLSTVQRVIALHASIPLLLRPIVMTIA